MNAADAKALIATYGTSYFWRPEPIESVGGADVPVLRGRALVAAMIENVEASRRDMQGTAARLAAARADGLLDRDAFAGLDRDTKRAWMAAVETLRGDHVRAVSELQHWQEYAEWASEQEAAGTPRLPAPPAEPDRRLPVERDEEEVPF